MDPNNSCHPGTSRRILASRCERRIHLKYLAATFLAVGTAVSVQALFVLKSFEPRMLMVPFIMASVIGLLLGRVMVLRERLRRQGDRFRAVAELAQEFTYFRNNDGSYDYVSPAAYDITGWFPNDFYTTPDLMNLLVHPSDRERWLHHVDHMSSDGLPETLDVRITTRDGRDVWITHICGPVFDEAGNLVGQRATNVDITQRKAYEERIERMAYYDALTDLPNRNYLTRALRDQIEAAIAADARGESHPFALLFLDLDRFNHINDSFGHAFGDRLLVQLAQRLRECCEHHGVISRFGGDEFVIVAAELAEPADAVAYAHHLLEAVEQPFTIDEQELYLSGSVGIALYPYDGEDADTLIRNADAAMYKIKKDRDDHIRLYSPEMVRDAAQFIGTENRMRRALAAEEFILHYQPKVDIESGEIVSLEALVRWNSPEQGLIPPAEFIPVAEETGLIRPLGEQILRSVCGQIAEWERIGIRVPVAVNISGRQFSDPNFCAIVEGILDQTRCDVTLLELEVTEQVFLHDMESTIGKLERLRDMGMTIALDDFGTGYSSLNYLKELPLDAVKIDMSFIRDITRNPRDLAILRAIILLCRDLKMSTVAEGIETGEQRTLLTTLGCGLGQGFLFHRALAPERIEELLTIDEDEPEAAAG